MGRVKEFAMWLSGCVYWFNMTDEEILSVLKSQNPEVSQRNIETWILEQINIVKKKPQVYKNMSE